jgi:uncharacterized protein
MENGLLAPNNWPYLSVYVVLWVAILATLAITTSFSPTEAVAGFVILLLVFPTLAHLFTRKSAPLPLTVRNPFRESALLLLYLVFVAVVLVKGFGPAGRIIQEPQRALAIFALKLVLFVTLPALLLVLFERYSLSDLFPLSFRSANLWPALWMSVAALAMQGFLGRGLRDISDASLSSRALLFGVPLSLLFLLFEVGLVEEFFFRTLLQERLASTLRSPWGGLVVSSLLFGLVHAPGLYMRPAVTQEALGPHPSLFLAIGYSIVVTSVAGFFLGVLWMRTKNLAVVAIVHAVTDFLPNLVPFCKNFHLQ